MRGVNFIHLTAVKGAKIGQTPIWDEPEVLLSQSDAEQLEGFLHAGWCRDPKSHGGESNSGGPVARVNQAEKRCGGEPREVIRVLKHQAYADDTTAKAEKSGRFEKRG